eukprot:gene38410-47424_t
MAKDSFVYKVSFKVSSKDFILHAYFVGEIAIGSSVIVAVDKKGSEDLGKVTEVHTLNTSLNMSTILMS